MTAPQSTSFSEDGSPKDKFLVREPSSEKDVDWGAVNQPMSEAQFEILAADVRGYLDGRDELFVQDLYCGADPAYRLSCRYVTPNAWHANFVRNMFIRPELAELAAFAPNFTILHAPEFQGDPAKHGVRSTTFIVLHLAKRMILIGGTRYAGELKKSMFTVAWTAPSRSWLTNSKKPTSQFCVNTTARCRESAPTEAN